MWLTASLCVSRSPARSRHQHHAPAPPPGENPANKFPLPDDFFPRVQVPPLQVQQYELEMDAMVQRVIHALDNHEALGKDPVYPAPWTMAGRVGELTTVLQQGPSTSLSASHAVVTDMSVKSRMFGQIKGDYQNVMDFYYADTSKQLFEWNQFMMGYVVDAAVLKNIHTPASRVQKPYLYMGLKWVCFHPFALVHKRDHCFLEYMTYTKDAHGRDMGIRISMSVDLPECPELTRLKVKRMHLLIVTAVRPSRQSSNSTDVFIMAENDFSGSHVDAGYYKRYMSIWRHLSHLVDSKRILEQGMVRRNNWVPNSSRRECSVCKRKFHATRYRHHCRLCGDVICGHCVVLRDAPKHYYHHSHKKMFKVVKTKFCALCIVKLRETEFTRRPTSATPPNPMSASMISTGTSGGHGSSECSDADSHEPTPEWRYSSSSSLSEDSVTNYGGNVSMDYIVERMKETRFCDSPPDSSKHSKAKRGSGSKPKSSKPGDVVLYEEPVVRATMDSGASLSSSMASTSSDNCVTIDQRLAEQEKLLRQISATNWQP